MGWPIGWTSLEPMIEMLWLDWSVDPADMEEPIVFPSPRKSAMTCGDSGFKQRKADGKVSTPKLGLVASRMVSTGPLPRIATGIKDRVNRLKAIGNGQVPQCMAMVWELLLKQ